jgi:TolB protein
VLPNSRLIFTALLATGVTAALLSGCSSSTKTTDRTSASSTSPASTHTSTLTNELDEVMENWRKEPVTWAGHAPYGGSQNESNETETQPTNSPGGDRYSTLIGLYGELITEPGKPEGRESRGNMSQVSFALEGACFDPSIDPTGQRIAFASTMHSTNANIYIKSVTGTSVTQVTSGSADNVMPSFSPDGNSIAFASNRDGKWDIYVTPVSGGAPVQLTRDNDHEIHPSFSPDGRMIAYCRYSSKSGRWEIWVTEVENAGVKRFLAYGMFPQWSPDVANSKILFQRPRQRGSRLHSVWTIDYVNGEALNPTEIVSAANAAVINPTWSPDGRFVAFATVLDPDQSPEGRPEQSDIWVVRSDGSGRTRLTDGQFANFQPIWSKDGSVYFVSDRSGVDNIWSVSASRLVQMTTTRESGLAGAGSGRDTD